MPEAETDLWGRSAGKGDRSPGHLTSGSPLITDNGQGVISIRGPVRLLRLECKPTGIRRCMCVCAQRGGTVQDVGSIHAGGDRCWEGRYGSDAM